MESSIEDRVADECEGAFAGLQLDPDRVRQAVVGGRRRRRNRQVVMGTGAAGGAAVLAAGGFFTLSATRVEHTTTLVGSTPPGLATAASSSAIAPAVVDVDGVTVGYLPAGYQISSETPSTLEAGLPCLRMTGADFLPAGESTAGVATPHRLMVTVSRGPVFFPNEGGGPEFGPTDLGQLTTSRYSAPGPRRGFLTAMSVRLGPQLVVTVEGADIDTDTIQAVVSGLVAGPADPTPASPAATDGATLGQLPPSKADEAHC